MIAQMEVRHLSFSVGAQTILDDVSLSLAPRHLTGIIGPNGSGKSTLLRFLSRHLPSTQAVFWDGQPVESIDRKEYAKSVAVMAQQSMAIAPELTVEQVVLMGRYPYKALFSGYAPQDYDIARRALEESGAAAYRTKCIGTLSGGERQRALIAKALAQEPELLLLDEPTNHLDAKYKLRLMELLAAFKQRGTAAVVLHDIALAARFCDDIIVMKGGRCRAKGPADAVLTTALLEEVFEVPFFSAVHDGLRYVYC